MYKYIPKGELPLVWLTCFHINFLYWVIYYMVSSLEKSLCSNDQVFAAEVRQIDSYVVVKSISHVVVKSISQKDRWRSNMIIWSSDGFSYVELSSPTFCTTYSLTSSSTYLLSHLRLSPDSSSLLTFKVLSGIDPEDWWRNEKFWLIGGTSMPFFIDFWKSSPESKSSWDDNNNQFADMYDSTDHNMYDDQSHRYSERMIRLVLFHFLKNHNSI